MLDYVVSLNSILPAIFYNRNADCFKNKPSGTTVTNRGTWIPGDILKELQPVGNTEYNLCTKGGTDRPISATGKIDAQSPDRILIPTVAEFYKFIGGEFIKVNGTSCRVMDYVYGTTDEQNYIVVDKPLTPGEGLSIVNDPPVFVQK